MMKASVALVSGGTTGIGKAIVQRLLRDGFAVAAFSRSAHKRDLLEQELAQQFASDRFLVLQGDVRTEADMESVVGAVMHTFGTIDVLVNNAGYGYLSLCDTFDAGDVRQLFETNVLGAMLLTKYVLPHMKKARTGRIINISSLSGSQSFPLHAFYSATKYALMGYSEGLRQEAHDHGIHVATVSPGQVSGTDFVFKTTDPAINNLFALRPRTTKALLPDDVAEAVSVLCKESGSSPTRNITLVPQQ